MFTLISGKLVRDGEQIGRVLHEAAWEKAPSLGKVAPWALKELVDLVDFALSLELTVRWPKASMMRRAVRMVYEQLRRDDEAPMSQAVVRYNVSGGLPPPAMSIMPPPMPPEEGSNEGTPIPTLQVLPGGAESLPYMKTVLGVGQDEKE
jgi:hypothetical protein